MKKILTGFFIVLISVTVSFSVEKMPADVKKVSDKIIKVTTNYYKSIGKVKSAKELAAAINRYSAEMEKLAPQIKAIQAKYGDMEDETDDKDSGNDISSDYAAIQEEWAKQMSGADFGDSFLKIQKYYSDPAVRKALEKLSRVMEDLDFSDEGADGEGESEGDDYGDE